MSVIISGSIAYDTVFTHEGRFADTLRAEALDRLNVTLQADSMRRTYGGCAANIAYSLKQLGGDPLVWTAVGRDADDYLRHLERQGIRTDGVTVMPNEWTAQCMITTDRDGNQLATFSPGAMAHADRLPWPDDTGIVCGILAPSVRSTLLAHAKAFVSHGIPFIFDPGQTTPLFSGDELLALTRAAACVAFSDYEALMIEEHTSLSPASRARSSAPMAAKGAPSGRRARKPSSLRRRSRQSTQSALATPTAAAFCGAWKGGLTPSAAPLRAPSWEPQRQRPRDRATASTPSWLKRQSGRALPSTAGHKEKGAPSRTAERLFTV